jgi:hypothetical protein
MIEIALGIGYATAPAVVGCECEEHHGECPG